MTQATDTLTLRDARAAYFAANGFPADGGYGEKWVTFRMGPLRFAIPNTEARVRAVRFHDLHHVATGYATDWTGEGEIGAFEVASGCAHHTAAWLLNLWAMAIGLVLAPRAMGAAFLRGRRSRNLYREAWSERLLDESVGALRARLGLAGPAGAPAATAADRLAFAGWSAASLGLALATLAVLLAPLALGVRLLL